MTEYEATVSREGKWWMVRVPEINGLTQARRLAEAELMARELVASTLDVPIERVAVRLQLESIGHVVDLPGRLEGIAVDRQRAAELERRAAGEVARLAKELALLDVPLRDVGTVLGISHQRAHQLLHG